MTNTQHVMSPEEYVTTYPLGGANAISFNWNGRHSADFVDGNQTFRKAVVDYCLANPDSAPPSLLQQLLTADAAWSREAWCAPNHFPTLASLVLCRCDSEVLPVFAKSMNASFDTFGACHQMELDDATIQRHLLELKRLVACEDNPETVTQLTAAQELLHNLAGGTACQGWVRVEPGTPATNVKVIYPPWHRRLWHGIRAWLSKLTKHA